MKQLSCHDCLGMPTPHMPSCFQLLHTCNHTLKLKALMFSPKHESEINKLTIAYVKYMY